MKWYEGSSSNDVFTAARIRIVRDLKDCRFPAKLSREERAALTDEMRRKLAGIGGGENDPFRYIDLSECNEVEKAALRERRVVNQAMIEPDHEAGLFLSADESTAVGLNGDDHIRIHKFGLEMNINQLYAACDRLDDWINERLNYAYDEKYGYLTSFPTSTGTGLKVSVILHLPYLSDGKKFRNVLSEVGRFGIKVKGLVGEGTENYGSLFEVTNMKTLGQTEEEILSSVFRMASHLAANERKVRSMVLRENRSAMEDQAYKAYGVLRYARRMSEKEALMYLSQIRAGVSEGLLELREPVNLFGLMWDCQDYSVRERRIGSLTKEECDIARAEWLRERVPTLAETR